MPSDPILVIGDLEFSGWMSVSITRSLESFAGSFSLSVSERWTESGERIAINDEDPCRVVVSGETLISGFIDRRSVSVSSTERKFTISGRDKSAVLADCSANPETYRRATALDIASSVSKQFGVTVTSDNNLSKSKIDRVVVNPGDSAFDVISRVAKESGLLAVSNHRGGLLLTRSGSRLASPVTEGDNVISASADFNVSSRFRRYVVGTQIPGDDNTNGLATSVKAVAVDESVRRSNRVKIIRPDLGMSRKFASRFADWSARTAAAKSASVTVIVAGWTQSDGKVWPINAVVPVHIPSIDVSGDMLISETVLSIGVSGELTTMRLVRPDAFTPEPSATVLGSGESWRGA